MLIWLPIFDSCLEPSLLLFRGSPSLLNFVGVCSVYQFLTIWKGRMESCINIPLHALMGQPAARLDTIALVK